MKIKRLILKNIRCFKELDMSFESEIDNIRFKDTIRRRTIILGNNGSGKSTILRSIALILAGSNSFGELVGDPKNWVNNKSKEGSIEMHLLTANGYDRSLKLVINRNDTLGKLVSKNRESLEILDEALGHATRNYLCIGYGVHRRVGSSGFKEKSSRFKNPRTENVSTIFSSEASLFPLESWLMDVDYRQGKKGLDAVTKGLNELLPNSEFYQIDKERKVIQFKNKDGIIDFNQLSDGFQITANWLGDLLYRITNEYKDYSDPFKAEFILLIDEIALHLHPAWQRLIIDSISALFPNAQIIGTTHSPFVAQQAKTEELYTIIRTDQNKIDLFHYKNDPRKLLVHQILISDIFGLSTDDSVVVEEYKNNVREKPLKSINQITISKKDKEKYLNDFKEMLNVDNLHDISINYYTEEKNGSINEMKKELKKMRDEEVK